MSGFLIDFYLCNKVLFSLAESLANLTNLTLMFCETLLVCCVYQLILFNNYNCKLLKQTFLLMSFFFEYFQITYNVKFFFGKFFHQSLGGWKVCKIKLSIGWFFKILMYNVKRAMSRTFCCFGLIFHYNITLL